MDAGRGCQNILMGGFFGPHVDFSRYFIHKNGSTEFLKRVTEEFL
jgi:hypothetical protein